MRQTITSEVLVAYSECRRKGFLLLCTTEQGSVPEYTKILEQRKRENQRRYINAFKQQNCDVRPFVQDSLTHGGEFLVDAILRIEKLEVTCAILRKADSHSSLGDYSYEPIAFASTHGISKEQKLDLLFAGYVLGQIQHKLPMTGRIIGMDGRSHAVNLESSIDTLVRFLEPLQEWSTAPAPETPPVILNRHCPYCQFQDLCRGKAEQEDNLSLLSGITPKMIRGYEKKGIFTVKQLSYLFKSRKKKKRVKSRITHKPELQALAIRTGKIYLQELPQLSKQPIEGILGH